MRIFKTRWTARFTRREQISDRNLREAVERAERGIIDADLGGGLIKQRVARQSQGRSGGYRMMIAYRMNDRAVFLLGFGVVVVRGGEGFVETVVEGGFH